jgi:FkbM family methyltransferase
MPSAQARLHALREARIGGRPLGTIVKALGEPRHYQALFGMGAIYAHPLRELRYYLLRGGSYPRQLAVRTPLGPRLVTLYSPDDLLTVNEIFCRRDYRASREVRVVVDFGSNIGISALYFLTRNPETRVFLHEPVPRNVARLRDNLSAFADRYHLVEACVGTEDGEVDFGVEPTGRYGGIGIVTGRTERFPARDVNGLLAEVFAQPGVDRIDILKTDIEGFDVQVLHHVRREYLDRIERIYAELPHGFPLPGFTCSQRGMIAQWSR